MMDSEKNSNINNNGEKTKSKAKSCKGCLYFSSQFGSNRRNPLCVGITRTLPQVPHYAVGDPDLEDTKEVNPSADFKYACVGYSVYTDKKASVPQNGQEELPFCVGIELLVDKRPPTVPIQQHVQRKEEVPDLSRPPSTYRPPQKTGEEFLTRLYRNAGVVAGGVARNVYKIGNYAKRSIDDILYPYRRRPK